MKRIWLLFPLLIPMLLFAQKQTTFWYFGENAGLDFSSGTPVAVMGSAMNKDEGCSSISDSQGNLLFYTNGIKVWNKNHQQMPNGFGLAGHESSSQSGLIVPKPGSNNLFYIFTTDAFFYGNGLKYSVVDMSQQSGLGNVTTKNTALYSPTTEKLTAVHHHNQSDYWLISHEAGNNTFRAYPITAAGVGTAVNSQAGAVHNLGSGGQDAIGCMKMSPDGSKLAVALYVQGKLEIFDFNNATGLVSNPVSFPAIYPNLYGVEFSASGKVLYFTSDSNLYQVDMQAGSSAGIIASAQKVGSADPGPFNAGYMGALQLALNGKIYGTNFFSEYLFVINEPEALGIECMYQEQGIYLGGKHCYAGLPGFVQSWLKTSVPSGLAEKEDEGGAQVFPNPTSGHITIKLPEGGEMWAIYDIYGRCLMMADVGNEKQISLEIQTNGVFFVRIKSTDKTTTNRIIVRGR